jgi:hypothetical protein
MEGDDYSDGVGKATEDYETVLDDHLNNAIMQRLDHIGKQQRLIALMLFIFAMCWAFSKLYPIIATQLAGGV